MTTKLCAECAKEFTPLFPEVVLCPPCFAVADLRLANHTLREKLAEAERERDELRQGFTSWKTSAHVAEAKLDSIRRVLDGETVESEDETVRRVALLYNSMKWVGENYGHILVGMALEAKQKDTTDAE